MPVTVGAPTTVSGIVGTAVMLSKVKPMGNVSTTIFVPFTAFATDVLGGATGPADFTTVGSIEETITVIGDQDVQVSLVESARPEQVTANVRNFQPLTIGNLVFQDNNNDGIFNNADAGIVGVDVQLFKLAAANSVVNPAVDTVTATTTTIAGGAYSFTNVEPGFYAIVIPASEFAAAATLQGFITGYQRDYTGCNVGLSGDVAAIVVVVDIGVGTRSFWIWRA